MNESQLLDDWIANYQATQRQKHAKFLTEIKHEFTQRTAQQRRDRLNEINQIKVPRVLLSTSKRRGRPTAAHPRKET